MPQRPAPQPASASGVHEGLAWLRYDPPRDVRGGVVILHGAGSSKEHHVDFARVCAAAGLAALVVDLRGHGASPGAMDARAIADVARLAAFLREEIGGAPVALRGSSMGGYLAIVAAEAAGAFAVVAICPASGEMLRRGLRAGRFDFGADGPALDALLSEHEAVDAIASLDVPVLLLHAEGDESVPVAHSRALAEAAPRAKLVVVPGGHHRSVQHDPELQAVAVRFLGRALDSGRRDA